MIELVAGGFLKNIVEDTTPVLGGDLDSGGFNVTVSGGKVFISGTGDVGFSLLNTDATFSNMMAVGAAGNPNYIANWDINTGTQDDTSKPSWLVGLRINTDEMLFRRAAAGGSFVTQMAIDNTGGIHMPNMKSGTTQGGAGASAGELWFDTDDADTVKMGV